MKSKKLHSKNNLSSYVKIYRNIDNQKMKNFYISNDIFSAFIQ